jgi:hypothetical protein
MTTASAKILSDWIDGQTRTSGQLSVEMRFEGAGRQRQLLHSHVFP